MKAGTSSSLSGGSVIVMSGYGGTSSSGNMILQVTTKLFPFIFPLYYFPTFPLAVSNPSDTSIYLVI